MKDLKETVLPVEKAWWSAASEALAHVKSEEQANGEAQANVAAQANGEAQNARKRGSGFPAEMKFHTRTEYKYINCCRQYDSCFSFSNGSGHGEQARRPHTFKILS